MIRKTIVGFVMIAALGLMVWSGFKEYQRRKQEAALQHAPQLALVPDGQAPPAVTPAGANAAEAEPQPLKGKPAPNFTLVDLQRQEGIARRLQRQSSSIEFLGHVVRAVQTGDSVAGKASRSIQSPRGLRCSGSNQTTTTPIRRRTPLTRSGVEKSATASGHRLPRAARR